MLKRTVRNLAVTGITIVSATVLTALSVTGAFVAAAPGASAATGFEIVNHDDLCLTAGIDAPAVQSTCTFASTQTWHEVSVSGHGIELRNGLNQCLAVAGRSKSLGARVYGWRCIGTPDQYWGWYVEPNYGLYIENDNSHLVVGVSGGSTAPGAAVVQWVAQAPPRGANQTWNFE